MFYVSVNNNKTSLKLLDNNNNSFYDPLRKQLLWAEIYISSPLLKIIIIIVVLPVLVMLMTRGKFEEIKEQRNYLQLVTYTREYCCCYYYT